MSAYIKTIEISDSQDPLPKGEIYKMDYQMKTKNCYVLPATKL